jgi:hypothetical protein
MQGCNRIERCLTRVTRRKQPKGTQYELGIILALFGVIRRQPIHNRGAVSTRIELEKEWLE